MIKKNYIPTINVSSILNNNFNSIMNDLSKKTLSETLLLIENFLLNENN